jgi:hypothetical protein
MCIERCAHVLRNLVRAAHTKLLCESPAHDAYRRHTLGREIIRRKARSCPTAWCSGDLVVVLFGLSGRLCHLTMTGSLTKGSSLIWAMANGGTGGRTPRRWSVAREATILEQLGEPGATLSIVAHRHAIMPSGLHRWRSNAADKRDFRIWLTARQKMRSYWSDANHGLALELSPTDGVRPGGRNDR